MIAKSYIKPKRLQAGARLGVVAPAGPGSAETTAAGLQWLQDQGFQVRTGKSVEQAFGYLAGSDDDRAADLNAMFACPEIDGIVCLRGGYGTMRLLDLLDFESIQANPKVFIGYSDITALHLAIGQRTGLVTFHGPMVASDFGRTPSQFTVNHFLKAVCSAAPIGVIQQPQEAAAPIIITDGKASGRLAGGNLSMISATMGTAYELDTSGKILFLEDIAEAPYRIDRMLTQLLLAGKLQAAAGIVFDVFADCAPEGEGSDFTIEEVLRDRTANLGIPVLFQLYFGHTADKATIPVGAQAEIRPGRGLIITEIATI